MYGRLLEALGRLQDGLELKLKALERDPFSPAVHLQISLWSWNQRRYDDAIEWASKTLALDPDHLLAREHLAAAYWKKGDFDRHMAENIRHAESYGASASCSSRSKRLTPAAAASAWSGTRWSQRRAEGQVMPAMQLALLHGEAGEMDPAFEHLDRAIEARDPSLVHLAVAPQWDSLRADPRFARCLTRMGLLTA